MAIDAQVNPFSHIHFRLLASAQTFAKFLYTNNGTHDYVIAKSNSTFTLLCGYTVLPVNTSLVFSAWNSKKDYSDSLKLSKNLKKESISFAVELFTNKNETRRSDKSLEHWIDKIDGDIIIRQLTNEERHQLKVYKGKQTGWYFSEAMS